MCCAGWEYGTELCELYKKHIYILTLVLLKLFVNISHLFQAGINDAISSFKWMKNNIIHEK